MTDHSDLIDRLRAAIDLGDRTGSRGKRPENIYNVADEALTALSSQSLSLSEAGEEIERLTNERDEALLAEGRANTNERNANIKLEAAEARAASAEVEVCRLSTHEAQLEKRRDYYRVRMEIAERDREEADARVRAAQPFFAIRDAIPIGDGLKLVSKDRFDDMTPITITVTKGQYLRAFEAFSDASRGQGKLPEHADANTNPPLSDLSSLRKGAEVAVTDAARDLLFHLELYDFSERDPSGELNEKMAGLKAALVSGSREDGDG